MVECKIQEPPTPHPPPSPSRVYVKSRFSSFVIEGGRAGGVCGCQGGACGPTSMDVTLASGEQHAISIEGTFADSVAKASSGVFDGTIANADGGGRDLVSGVHGITSWGGGLVLLPFFNSIF